MALFLLLCPKKILLRFSEYLSFHFLSLLAALFIFLNSTFFGIYVGEKLGLAMGFLTGASALVLATSIFIIGSMYEFTKPSAKLFCTIRIIGLMALGCVIVFIFWIKQYQGSSFAIDWEKPHHENWGRASFQLPVRAMDLKRGN